MCTNAPLSDSSEIFVIIENNNNNWIVIHHFFLQIMTRKITKVTSNPKNIFYNLFFHWLTNNWNKCKEQEYSLSDIVQPIFQNNKYIRSQRQVICKICVEHYPFWPLIDRVLFALSEEWIGQTKKQELLNTYFVVGYWLFWNLLAGQKMSRTRAHDIEERLKTCYYCIY